MLTKLAAVLALASISLPYADSYAAEPYHPKLQNSKSGEFHDFPLGVLSATGRLADGEREILVMHVGEGGAAAAGGLQVGDRIATINGAQPAPFSKKTDAGIAGPQTDLAGAIEVAGATAPHRLALGLRRGEKQVAAVITVPASPAFADTFPADCPKRARFVAAIAKHLAATQRDNGSWKPGVGGDADVYTSAFCGLALLASGEPEYLPAVRSAIGFVKGKSIASIKADDPTAGPKNWQTAVNAILLAEYQLASGDDTYAAELKTCCDLLSARVTEAGTMGHHHAIPYNGGGLVIINTQAHLAWALAEKCGLEIDAGAWDRSLAEVRKSVDKRTGAIGYSSRAPGSPDIAARTGAMAAALAVAGEEPEFAEQLAGALAEYHGRMRHAHAMSSIGVIYGFAALKAVAPDDYAKTMRAWVPYFELSRSAAGPASYFGGKRNIGGDEYLGLQPIGNAMVALALAAADGRLFMHGGEKKGWLKK